MHKEGHIGVALAAYAPIAFATARAGFVELALLGAGLTAALATLPDADKNVPFVSHRGYSHTVWFALLVGAGCSIAGACIGRQYGDHAPELAAFVAAIGVTTILSHIAADAVTPMGVRPFAPFGSRFSLRLVRAANRPANLALLALGVSILAGALSAATGTG